VVTNRSFPQAEKERLFPVRDAKLAFCRKNSDESCYLQTASSPGDTHAIFLGLVTMLSVIVILDQVVWRPVIAWSQKFRFEQVESSERRHSPVLHFLQRSRALSLVSRRLTRPLSERVILYFARRQDAQPSRMRKVHIMTWTFRAIATLAMVGFC
jgi:NitT/TauT family transport system permease protein